MRIAFTFAAFISSRSFIVSSTVTVAPPVGENSWRFTPLSLIFSPFILYTSFSIMLVRNPMRCNIFSPFADKITSYNLGFSVVHFSAFFTLNSAALFGATVLLSLSNCTTKGITLSLRTVSTPSLPANFVSILKSVICSIGRTSRYTLRNMPEKRNLS